MASQLSVSCDTRWGTQSDYTMERGRCLCHGKRPSQSGRINSAIPREPIDLSPDAPRRHRVWVAFLMYDNDEYQRERSMRDYIVPMNWLTTLVTGSQFIHCQLVLWDEQRKQYYTYSVDDRRPVHVYDQKSFKNGWRFIALDLTEPQELIVHNFCVAQLGKPLNKVGQLSIFVLPRSGNGTSWFCSEIVAAALYHAGIIDFDAWSGVDYPCQVAPHMLFDFLVNHCTTCPVTLLAGNPVGLNNLHRLATAVGPIAMTSQTGGLLPASITAHVAAATAPPPEPQADAPLLAQQNMAAQLALLPRPDIRRPRSSLDYLVIRK